MARKRSHWAWGWEDNMPSAHAREQLGEVLSAVLQITPRTCREVVPLADVKLRRSAFSGDFADTSDEARIRHTYGRSWPDLMRGFLGDFDAAPDGVFVAQSASDVKDAFEWADKNQANIQIYGGGTSLEAGVECEMGRPTLCLDTTGMNGVREIDPKTGVARIGGGTFGPAIENGLRPFNLTLGHFPHSFEFSTLGGWIATRSKGHYATHHTLIDDFVKSVEMVSPSGLVKTSGLPLTGAGPNSNGLVCGSEGTLGVITEAWMNVQTRPRYKSQAKVLFKEWSSAVGALREISKSRLNTASCRLFDSKEARLNQMIFDNKHVLLVGCDSDESPQYVMEQALEMSKAHGGDCPKGILLRDEHAAHSGDRWKNSYMDWPYVQSALLTMGVFAETVKTTVLWEDFETFHQAMISRSRDIMNAACGAGFVTCRIAHSYPDGLAPYYTWIAPMPVRDASSIQTWQYVKHAITDAVVELGGHISHHHAVGRTHREPFHREASPLILQSLRAIKRELDPKGMVNPGVLL